MATFASLFELKYLGLSLSIIGITYQESRPAAGAPTVAHECPSGAPVPDTIELTLPATGTRIQRTGFRTKDWHAAG